MSYITWTPHAVASEAIKQRKEAWRIVEAQHIASTMKIVDSSAEQDLLESLIESSKPALPPITKKLHYLLATPFRYPLLPNGSRFRDGNDPGVFYGAESVGTACAELGYWRWRFLQEAVDLTGLEPVAHTAFSVSIAAVIVDLRQMPFNRDSVLWKHRTSYAATQQFAKIAREANIGSILYESVRDPKPSWCVAVLTPEAFSKNKPNPNIQTWWMSAHKRTQTVDWRTDHVSITFDASQW